jgi:hypothetical protein
LPASISPPVRSKPSRLFFLLFWIALGFDEAAGEAAEADADNCPEDDDGPEAGGGGTEVSGDSEASSISFTFLASSEVVSSTSFLFPPFLSGTDSALPPVRSLIVPLPPLPPRPRTLLPPPPPPRPPLPRTPLRICVEWPYMNIGTTWCWTPAPPSS